ncbi:MAG: hypothetical protein AB7T16_05885 [Dehalococcoidia bacterium]
MDLERVGDVDVRFFAFRPRGLELAFDEDDDTDEGWRLKWSGFEVVSEVEGQVEPRCIDDYLGLADVESNREASLDFVERWGLPNLGDPDLGLDAGDGHKTGYLWLSDLENQAVRLGRLLLAFLATEEGTHLSADELIALGAHEYSSLWFRTPEEEAAWEEVEAKRRAAFEETIVVRVDGGDSPPSDSSRRGVDLILEFHEQLAAEARSEWLRRRERDRKQGDLSYQRALIAHLVTTFSDLPYPTAGWDSAGRKLVAEVLGADSLVGEELRQIFQAPQLDVYACSVCGRPFVFDERTGKRRPRRGAGRFCSEEHRAEAKRRSNQASWHRNKKEWRR